MELYQEMLIRSIEDGKWQTITASTTLDVQKLIEGECYIALERIKSILEDESLSDSQCYMKIEEIVCVFEKVGHSVLSRHDFG